MTLEEYVRSQVAEHDAVVLEKSLEAACKFASHFPEMWHPLVDVTDRGYVVLDWYNNAGRQITMRFVGDVDAIMIHSYDGGVSGYTPEATLIQARETLELFRSRFLNDTLRDHQLDPAETG